MASTGGDRDPRPWHLDQCCPSDPDADLKTFPCPWAERSSFIKCDTGADGLVNVLLQRMTAEDKMKFLQGAPSLYTGAAAAHENYTIPSLNLQDAGQGFRADTWIEHGDQVTSWPTALTVASLWSEDHMGRWAAALGKEAHKKGANVLLGPAVNVHRIARGGRNAEYMSGESPFLGARLVKPYVKGLQSQRVLAVVKHFVSNEQETNRSTMNAIVDPKTQNEMYYPPFRAAVDAGVASVMCSYNKVNGEHACGNRKALVDDLKGAMDFKGWVMSDWWAVHSFAAAEGGVDQEMPGNDLLNALGLAHSPPGYFTREKLASLSSDKLNEMVKPMLSMMINNGLFEPEGRVCQPEDCFYARYVVNASSPDHQALSQELATKAVMLLKNEKQVLPIGQAVKNIALLGSACNAAEDVAAELDGREPLSYYNIGGSGRVIAVGAISVRAALEDKCGQGGRHCTILGEYTDNVEASLLLGSMADVAIVCGATTAREGWDRQNLSVDQQDYIVGITQRLADRAIPVVTVTMTPGAIVMPWAAHADAILNLFIAGKYTGAAFADVLFGDAAPSAKSPVTFPLAESQMLPPCETEDCPYTEGLFVGYLGVAGEEVLFPFGHGLSYTTFGYSPEKLLSTDPRVSPKDAGHEGAEVDVETEGQKLRGACRGAVVCVRAQITNLGDRAGVEVAQLYLSFPDGHGEPQRQLRGFSRLADELQPQKSQVVSFALFERDLQVYDVDGSKWVTPVGEYQVYVGSSSRDIRFETSFHMH